MMGATAWKPTARVDRAGPLRVRGEARPQPQQVEVARRCRGDGAPPARAASARGCSWRGSSAACLPCRTPVRAAPVGERRSSGRTSAVRWGAGGTRHPAGAHPHVGGAAVPEAARSVKLAPADFLGGKTMWRLRPRWVWRDQVMGATICIVSLGSAYLLRASIHFPWVWLGLGIFAALSLIRIMLTAIWDVRHQRHWTTHLWRSK